MGIKEPILKTPNDELSESKFLHLQAEFRQELPNTLSSIEQLWKKIVQNNNNADDLKDVTQLILHLADTAGTYGTDEVSYIARKCYLTFKPFQGTDYSAIKNTDITESLDNWFMQLRVVSNEWLSNDTLVLQSKKIKSNQKEKTVYSLLGDDVFSSELTIQVEKKN